jgi:hypothetical protein
MKALEQLAESEPKTEWSPQGEWGKALKPGEDMLRKVIRKGHGNRTIYAALGFREEADFNSFDNALNGLRRFMRKETD